MLGAARNSDTYRCAISINGIVDLEMQKTVGVFGDKDFRVAQIGSDPEKMKRDSPLQNVAKINIPVLLVHGTKDWIVQSEHTDAMERALEREGKDYDTVIIKNGGHDLERRSDRITLLKEVEGFLAENLK